jgi:hypothetical protein
MRVLSGVALTIIAASSAMAQTPTTPLSEHLGETVRVLADCTAGKNGHCARYTGALAGVSGDSLVVWSGELEQRIPRSAIQRVEVRRGTKGNARLVGGIGAAVGFVVGVIPAASHDCSDEFLQDLCDASRVMEPLAAAGIGALVGGVIGLLVREDRWVEAGGLPVTFRVEPSDAGVRLAVGATF